MTEADLLFERFCRERTVECRRLVEGGKKTPDYAVRLDNLLIAVEVKQLEPNAEDMERLRKLLEKRPASAWEKMERPRQSILDATRQLRAHAKGVMPAICCLYDTLGGLFGYLDPGNIAQCLYGGKCYDYVVPDYEINSNRSSPEFVGVRPGGRQIATPKHNTTLSAVAVLRFNRASDKLSMQLFHNHHAAIAVPPEAFRLPDVWQFAYRSALPGAIPYWVPV